MKISRVKGPGTGSRKDREKEEMLGKIMATLYCCILCMYDYLIAYPSIIITVMH